jgi:predicted dehydrogenase
VVPNAGDLPWNGAGITQRVANALTGNYPPPAGLAWDLFIGPSPMLAYHPLYHPHHWRGWVDWGVGAIGDMGAHLLDVTMWGLELGFPSTIETVSTPFNGASYPHATTTFYDFPARGNRPAVKLTWYDGGLLPPKPVELGAEELNKEGGALLIGTKGTLMHETYGARPRILQPAVRDAAGTPPATLPRIPDEHHEQNWVDAAKGKVQASSPFEYAARLTEVMLLGVVSLRAGKKLVYDGATMRVTNDAAANAFLQREPRQGWSYK